MLRQFTTDHTFRVLLVICVLAFLFTNPFLIQGKRLRLPILLRSLKIECTFERNECGINERLDQFELFRNSTYYVAGRCEFYQFAIKSEESRNQLKTGRFSTSFFPNLDSPVGCLHVEYNVQGPNTFLFTVRQKTKSSVPIIVYSNLSSNTASNWRDVNIDVRLFEHEESQYLFEVLCQNCSKGSTFSITQISFTWEKCGT